MGGILWHTLSSAWCLYEPDTLCSQYHLLFCFVFVRNVYVYVIIGLDQKKWFTVNGRLVVVVVV